jgi:hypothetical protein
MALPQDPFSGPNDFRFDFETITEPDSEFIPDTRSAAGVVGNPGGQSVSEQRFNTLFPDFQPLSQRNITPPPIKPEGQIGGATLEEILFNIEQGIPQGPGNRGINPDAFAPETLSNIGLNINAAAQNDPQNLGRFLGEASGISRLFGGSRTDAFGDAGGATGGDLSRFDDAFDPSVFSNIGQEGFDISDALSQFSGFDITDADIGGTIGSLFGGLISKVGGPLGAGIGTAFAGGDLSDILGNMGTATAFAINPLFGLAAFMGNALFSESESQRADNLSVDLGGTSFGYGADLTGLNAHSAAVNARQTINDPESTAAEVAAAHATLNDSFNSLFGEHAINAAPSINPNATLSQSFTDQFSQSILGEKPASPGTAQFMSMFNASPDMGAAHTADAESLDAAAAEAQAQANAINEKRDPNLFSTEITRLTQKAASLSAAADQARRDAVAANPTTDPTVKTIEQQERLMGGAGADVFGGLNPNRPQRPERPDKAPRGGDGGGDGGGGSGCFHADTPVDMADGSTKRIIDIKVGELTRGGKVFAILELNGDQRWYNYNGVVVSDFHPVREDGVWMEVHEAEQGYLTDISMDLCYCLVTSENRIYSMGNTFTDWWMIPSDHPVSLGYDKQAIEALNEEERQSA